MFVCLGDQLRRKVRFRVPSNSATVLSELHAVYTDEYEAEIRTFNKITKTGKKYAKVKLKLEDANRLLGKTRITIGWN